MRNAAPTPRGGADAGGGRARPGAAGEGGPGGGDDDVEQGQAGPSQDGEHALVAAVAASAALAGERVAARIDADDQVERQRAQLADEFALVLAEQDDPGAAVGGARDAVVDPGL